MKYVILIIKSCTEEEAAEQRRGDGQEEVDVDAVRGVADGGVAVVEPRQVLTEEEAAEQRRGDGQEEVD
eukprot:CAMPEP_0113730414 /NCGR_PEP_ID=MMETSP0038_2-20120614/43144_1 /TAXON_ID=2898 /ORGANISM="Cryptomonas paramecium" /LENGTH=68 /DNA_ID=CAMNT_0000662469 /DNA_START=40 /DNA_END=244 /DNA_ORIENTATION=- /assembly_acc=CAM_ASM_000170